MKSFKISSIIKEQQLDAFKSDKPFDFADFEDSGLDGPGIESVIVQLIYDLEEELQKTIPADPKLRAEARNEIKHLFTWNLNRWKDRNRGQGIPGGSDTPQ